jgi:ribosomal protein L37E
MVRAAGLTLADYRSRSHFCAVVGFEASQKARSSWTNRASAGREPGAL